MARELLDECGLVEASRRPSICHGCSMLRQREFTAEAQRMQRKRRERTLESSVFSRNFVARLQRIREKTSVAEWLGFREGFAGALRTPGQTGGLSYLKLSIRIRLVWL